MVGVVCEHGIIIMLISQETNETKHSYTRRSGPMPHVARMKDKGILHPIYRLMTISSILVMVVYRKVEQSPKSIRNSNEIAKKKLKIRHKITDKTSFLIHLSNIYRLSTIFLAIF